MRRVSTGPPGAVMNERNLKHYLPAAVAVVDLITRGGGEG